MSRLSCWLRGYLRLRLTGASVSWFLNAAEAAGLSFWDVKLCDEFHLELSVPRDRSGVAHAVAERSMCQMEVLGEGGLPRRLKGISGRVAIVAAITLAALVSVELSSRVWFFRVEGNVTVPSARILRAVHACGVPYGTRGADIHPQTVKNRVLAEIDELAWLTVTHNGADAVVIVREREPITERINRKDYCNLVAARDGVISSVTVLEGAAAVSVGQHVSQGDVLISGEIPLEQTVRICGAVGEVYAHTQHDSTVVTPQSYGEKSFDGKEKRRVSLRFGKKRIKIYEDSGILNSKCDKMTMVKPITLSGGRALPISVETECYLPFCVSETPIDRSAAEKMICASARNSAMRSMVNGTLLWQTCELSVSPNAYRGLVRLEANEMIAVRSPIRMITGDTNDGARNQRGANGAAD